MNRKFISKSNYVLHRVLNSKQGVEILKDFIESILEIEIKEIYSKKYGIFIDIDNQYRTFQGVKISNINAYLYKCEE